MRTLYDSLILMHDIKVEIHIVKNREVTDVPCEEIKVIEGECGKVSAGFILNKYGIDWKNTNVFYIGFTSGRSRTLRINCEYFGKEE